MSDLRVARDFLAHYLSSTMVTALDLGSLVLMPNSYVDQALKMVLSDVVYKVKLKAGEGAYIYCLCEHQSTCDPLMPFRMWQYVINIWADHLKQQKNHQNRLPLIVPLLFYTGEETYKGATDLRQLIQAPLPFIQEALFDRTFKLVDVNQIAEDELKRQQWVGMMALMMKHVHDRDVVLFLKQIIGSLKQLEQTGGADFVILLLNYCLNKGETLNVQEFVDTVQQGLSHKVGEKIMTIAQQLMEKGKLEGIIEGETKAKAEGDKAIRKIAENAFREGLPLQTIQKITGFSLEELAKLRDKNEH